MSENKTLNKNKAIVAAGMALTAFLIAAAFSSVIPVQVAAAQEGEREAERTAHREAFTRARAIGVATDADGNDFRSVMVQAIKKVDGEDNKYETKAGFIAIRLDNETRAHYKIIPDTWEITVAEDNLTFDATGKVEDKDGNEYEVDLDGYFARHVPRGNVWAIEGTMEGNGVAYELHYVGLSRIGHVVVVEDERFLEDFQ